jgi:hypothetical protein
MRKRLLSLTTALCLAISFCTSVYATQVADESQDSTEGYVAQVGQNKFTDFSEALNSLSSGDTVTLLDDVTESVVPVFTECTLDLNGHTLKADEISASKYFILVFTGYSLTIKDSAGGGCIQYYGGSDAITIMNNGTLCIQSGTIIGGGTAIYSVAVDGIGGCTIEGGTIVSNGVAIHVDGGNLTVLGGMIQSGGDNIFAIEGAENYTVAISGGRIVGKIDESFYTNEYQTPTVNTVFYTDISQYRTGGNYTAPEKDGTVFCGWYQDADGTKYMTEAEANEATMAYAKFVDQDVLSVARQITYDTTENSTETNLRLVTTVDSTNYRKVGFSIQRGEDTSEQGFTTVYERILGRNGAVLTEYKPTVFSDESQYFLALEIEQLPQEIFDTQFTVIPFWITPDGTRVAGNSSIFTISDTIAALQTTQS